MCAYILLVKYRETFGWLLIGLIRPDANARHNNYISTWRPYKNRVRPFIKHAYKNRWPIHDTSSPSNMFVSKPSNTRIYANTQTWNFLIPTKQTSLLRANWVSSLRMLLKSQVKLIWGFSLSGWVSALRFHGQILWNCLTLVLYLRWWFSVWYCNRNLHWGDRKSVV